MGYELHFKSNAMFMELIFGSSETLIVTNTYQFEDYLKCAVTLSDANEKAKRRKEVFPIDCQKAFEMGARIAQQSNF